MVEFDPYKCGWCAARDLRRDQYLENNRARTKTGTAMHGVYIKPLPKGAEFERKVK